MWIGLVGVAAADELAPAPDRAIPTAKLLDLAVGDFDGDGRLDVVWLDLDLRRTVAFGPTFAAGPSAPTDAWALAAADADGDGVDDVVALGAGGITLTRGGPGGLADTPDPAVPAPDAWWVRALGDVDGDGDDDFGVGVDLGDLTSAGRLWFGDAAGLVPGPDVTVPSDRQSVELLPAGDVDGDGRADVLAARRWFSFYQFTGTLELFRGAPGGVEAAPSWVWAGLGAPRDALALDVDGDGDGARELAVVDAWNPHTLAEGRVVVLADVEAAPTELAVGPTYSEPYGTTPHLLALGGLLAVANGPSVVAVIPVDGELVAEGRTWGSQAGSTEPPTGPWTVARAVGADVDGDGVQDLVSAWNDLAGGTVAIWASGELGTGGTAETGAETGSETGSPTGSAGSGRPDGGCGCAGAPGASAAGWLAWGGWILRGRRRREVDGAGAGR